MYCATIEKLLIAIFLFIFLTALGIGLGSAVSREIIHLYRLGMFVSWESLNSPIKFTRIVEATPDTVWALTVEGNLYYWNTYCEAQEDCNRWIEVKDISKDAITTYKSSMKDGNSCEGLSGQFTLLKEPPEIVVQCSFTKFDERIIPEKNSYYAVLNDGTIWVWRYTDLFVDRLLFIPLVCEFVGFILSMATFVFLLIRKRDETQRKLALQKVKNMVLNILLLVAFSIGGIFVGFKVGYSIEFPSSEFTPWELLVSPVKFKQITDLNDYGVWAQTTEGKLYVWDFNGCQYPATCHQWAKANNIPNDANENGQLPFNKSNACPQSDGLPPEPPGKVIECTSIVMKNGPSLSNFYYALLEDGTIWRWAPPAVSDSPILTFFICPSIGLLLGLVIGAFFIYLRIRKKKQLPAQS